jgi:hypothetical protein
LSLVILTAATMHTHISFAVSLIFNGNHRKTK